MVLICYYSICYKLLTFRLLLNVKNAGWGAHQPDGSLFSPPTTCAMKRFKRQSFFLSIFPLQTPTTVVGNWWFKLRFSTTELHKLHREVTAQALLCLSLDFWHTLQPKQVQTRMTLPGGKNPCTFWKHPKLSQHLGPKINR